MLSFGYLAFGEIALMIAVFMKDINLLCFFGFVLIFSALYEINQDQGGNKRKW